MFNIQKSESGKVTVKQLSEEIGVPRRELDSKEFATIAEADAYVLGYIIGKNYKN